MSSEYVCIVIVLGGSWAVISGAISPLIWVISRVTLLITLLITTLNPIDPLKGTLIITLLITTREPLSKAQKVAALQIIQT